MSDAYMPPEPDSLAMVRRRRQREHAAELRKRLNEQTEPQGETAMATKTDGAAAVLLEVAMRLAEHRNPLTASAYEDGVAYIDTDGRGWVLSIERAPFLDESVLSPEETE